MALKFLKLYADMQDDHFGVLTDEELGIIVRASMAYAFDGTLPDFEPRSVLGLTWRRMKAHIDASEKQVEALSENGAKGVEAKAGKRKQTQANVSKPKQPEANASKIQQASASASKGKHKQEQEHIHEQEQEQEQYNARAREDATATAEPVEAFDGTDLSEDIRLYAVADGMIRAYGLPDNDATRGAVIDDIRAHGEGAMREVLKKAALANSRGKLSVNFYRAIMNDTGGKARASPEADYIQRQHDDDYWNSIVTNLDEEDS